MKNALYNKYKNLINNKMFQFAMIDTFLIKTNKNELRRDCNFVCDLLRQTN